MAQGLQIFDENGNSTLDTNNDTVKILKVVKGVSEGAITDVLLTQGIPFYIVTPVAAYGKNKLQVSFSGNTCTFKVTDSSYELYIGVY